MPRFRSSLPLAFSLALVFAPAMMHGQQSAPDNSNQNKSIPHSRTADKQMHPASDRRMAAQVRKAIFADKTLSTYAHNVKILVTDGKVTLEGPVHSDDEKSKVAADAATVVSSDMITNNLTVK